MNTNVDWWLDVEGAGQYWTSSTADNAQTVLGAIDALHNTEGVADVGIYASPGTWNSIVGNYQPSVPYWMADWLNPPSGPATCAAVAGWQAKEQLPDGTGRVRPVQRQHQRGRRRLRLLKHAPLISPSGCRRHR